MWIWLVVESAMLLGIPAYVLWYPLNPLHLIVLAGFMVLFLAKKSPCVYVVRQRAKEAEEKGWTISAASKND